MSCKYNENLSKSGYRSETGYSIPEGFFFSLWLKKKYEGVSKVSTDSQALHWHTHTRISL